ncbi:hypothetical protein HYT23_02480 [Candidatus Pacearchaeota archaeon]|nr:hypothetical protein [Candidatus Pacearchaeota archaeon]
MIANINLVLKEIEKEERNRAEKIRKLARELEMKKRKLDKTISGLSLVL